MEFLKNYSLRGVDGDVIVEHWHHVGEVVEPVRLEDVVDDVEHGPHVVADLGARQVARKRERFLVELHDRVGEDVVNGLH